MTNNSGGKGSFWDNPFGGIFDFNRNGKEEFSELWIAQKVFEDCTKEEGNDFSDDYIYHSILDEDGPSVDISWRDYCEDGSEFDLDPEDYESEDEYSDALEEARGAWRDTCDDSSEYGLDPEDYDTEDEYMEALEEAQANADSSATSSISLRLNFSVEFPALDKLEEIKEENYPNKRRFNAAYTLANEFCCYRDKKIEQRDKACCQFIIDNADKIIAANYLSNKGGFLYTQAIKDSFQLPVSLPDEDEYKEYMLSDTLCKIAKRNTALSFEVWEWTLATFLPYTQYADDSLSELTSEVIDSLYSFPENYKTELARYMDKHPDFMETVVDKKAKLSSGLDTLIATALQDGMLNTALVLFKRGLAQAGNDWKKINIFTAGTISQCKNYAELESAEYFKLNMLPFVKAIDIGMVQDEIEEWEKELDDYISEVEKDCERYTYTRKNAWRKTVPDGSKYGLYPQYYDSEQEYMEDLNKEKYGWREWYKEDDTLGLDVNAFETQEEFQKVYYARRNEKRQKECLQRLEEEKHIEAEKARIDDKVYTFCGVAFPHAHRPYYYRTDDPTIRIGDEVLVPAGDKETTGTVVAVGQYMRIAAPYPVDKSKFIISKVNQFLSSGQKITEICTSGNP